MEAENPAQHSGDRSFAVGTCYLDETKMMVRIMELVQNRSDIVQTEFHPLFLDLFQITKRLPVIHAARPSGPIEK